ncbi:MAG: hypothetical protein MAG581_00938 [Deltaproteobacteria bacterium]|nr:hypothetical protein [Deltaproteobacteria bacterium]
MHFKRVKFVTVSVSLLLGIWYFYASSGSAVAQSLLSDRIWLEQSIDVFNEKELPEQYIPPIPFDLPTTALTQLETVARPHATDNPKLLYTAELSVKPALPVIQPEETQNKSASSFLSRFFPWFKSMDPSVEIDTETAKINDEDWANSEFTNVSMTVADIEKMIVNDPETAREKYLEYEDWLQIEDRVRLKVQLLYHLQQWAAAEKLAIAFLNERPRSRITPIVYYFFNKSLQSQEKPLNQNMIWRELALNELAPKLRSELLIMFSEEAKFKGKILAAVQYRLDHLKNSGTSETADHEIISLLLKQIQTTEELRILMKKYPDFVWMQKQIFQIELEILSEQRRYREALELLDQRLSLARETGNLEQYLLLEKKRRSLVTALNVSPRRIGVILPMSSSNAKIAELSQQTLNGLWLALQANRVLALSANREDNSSSHNKMNTENSDNETVNELSQEFDESWELVIRDSHLDAEKTKAAIRELVEIEGVIAIIGPLARKTSEAAAEEAERLGVPLISLSLTDSIPQLGEFIFRNNKSWKQEVQKLADYAIGKLQACRFLILYAKTREGRQKMRLFLKAASLKGCEAVAVEGFKDEGQKSLVNEFDTFTGKTQRVSETDKNILKELKEKEDPVKNFDAVFVAVGSGGVKNLRLILPYSAVYKMKKTKFLGDSGWNDTALPFSPGVRGVRRPVFVDSFFLGSNTPEMLKLKRIHERILYRHQNYVGPSAYTAHAYDTLMILMQLLNDKHNHSHRDLKDALINIESYKGVSGNLRFDDDGEVQREIHLLTLHRGAIQPLF